MHHYSEAGGRVGLTDQDRAQIRAGIAALPGNWGVTYECGDEGDVYAIVRLPANKLLSAFLIDREDGQLIVTDNVSNPHFPVLIEANDAAHAVEYVRRIMVGDHVHIVD